MYLDSPKRRGFVDYPLGSGGATAFKKSPHEYELAILVGHAQLGCEVE